MWPYWLLFCLIALAALEELGRPNLGGGIKNVDALKWWVVSCLLVLMIGFRHEVGGDWLSYLAHVELADGVPLEEALFHTDPAYSFLNWIAALWGGVYLVNFVCALLFVWGLMSFCHRQPLPWLALLIAVPYLIIVVAMGYTRQGVAIGLAMLSLVAIENNKINKFVLWIAVAMLFHKSAIILLPFAILAAAKRKIWMVLWVSVVGSVLFMLLLQESIDALKSGYLEAEYQSSGAAIRVYMNALPALIFLIFHNRFGLASEERRFWIWMSLSGLFFVLLLYVSPSSTAVDRVALYWIPLQLFLWSRLPMVLAGRVLSGMFFGGLIVLYSGAVLFVWLEFGQFSFNWIPYKFLPLEWFLALI